MSYSLCTGAKNMAVCTETEDLIICAKCDRSYCRDCFESHRCFGFPVEADTPAGCESVGPPLEARLECVAVATDHLVDDVQALYPPDWPMCAAGCGRPALDGHATCGELACNESAYR